MIAALCARLDRILVALTEHKQEVVIVCVHEPEEEECEND